MRRFAVEIKITLLVLLVVAAIVSAGYLSYKNLASIVTSIHNETRPDYTLLKLKEINASLNDVDNNVRLYALTHEDSYLGPYNTIISSIDKKIDDLTAIQGKDSSNLPLIREMSALIGEKLVIWDQILQLHYKTYEKEVFTLFYQTLEKKTSDSSNVKKSNIISRFFRKKKEITLGREEIKEEVSKLEKKLTDRNEQIATLEEELIQKNKALNIKLAAIISSMEDMEKLSFARKSREADALAQTTYQWLAGFIAGAVLLLLMVLFVLFRYTRKMYAYQRVLKQAKTEAEKLAKAKEMFIANVSHELRTPMNAIYGLTEQLIQQPIDHELKEQLGIIRKSSVYLNTIVNDVLDFSKIQAGKLMIESLPFDLAALLNEVYSLNKGLADQKKLSFSYTEEPNVPKILMGDPIRLKQILQNLISNAIKFTHTGEIVLEVKSTLSNSTKAEILFTIKDTGIGIAPEKLESIFEDFTQAGPDTSRVYGGTGLGLSIVKKLVELLEGTIDVKSEINKGSAFTCTLPFEISTETVLPQKAEPDFPETPSYFKNLIFLIADDEEYNRLILKTILDKWGISYKMVTNGQDAVKLAQEYSFDLILMDIRMPQLNGLEASQQIRSFARKAKIIAITAGFNQEDEKKYRAAGLTGYLIKPFSETELFKAVTFVLNTDPKERRQHETKVSSPPIDLHNLEKIGNGDKGFISEMIQIFTKTMDSGVKELSEQAQKENWQAVADAAHKMAPPCRHLGANQLLNNLKTIEKLCAETGSAPEIRKLISAILEESTIIKEYIEKELQA